MSRFREPQPQCPYCGRFVEKDPDGYYDTAKREAEPETSPIAAFCDERCACLFHDRPVPGDYWRPMTNKARQMRLRGRTAQGAEFEIGSRVDQSSEEPPQQGAA